MKKGLFTLHIICFFVACDTDDPFSNILVEDREIIEKAYSTTYQFPEDFYYETDLQGSPYYENTVSIRASQDLWIELHTNDKEQALNWSEISSTTSAYYRDLVAERETDKYFEFKRVYSIYPNDIILSRIHKSSYFIPSYDKFNRSSHIGTLKVFPINEEVAKTFIEYMWTNNLIGYNDKVLENKITETTNHFLYNLKPVSVTYGDFGICDVIEVNNFDFLIDKQSGEVTYESIKIKEIRGICR